MALSGGVRQICSPLPELRFNANMSSMHKQTTTRGARTCAGAETADAEEFAGA